MKHLDFTPSPISYLDFYSEKYSCNIIAKRDDLFTEAGGGSKARMLQYILADVKKDNVDIIITAGGPCSNFNRACALMCAKLGIPMHLIEYTNKQEEFESSLNYFICNLSGIKKTRCDKKDVPSTIKKVIASYGKRKIKFIYGGGKSLEGIIAYYEAIFELKKQMERIDHLFVSCGTGTTLTGICAGMQEVYPESHVHAISVARTFNEEEKILLEDMKILNNFLDKNYTFNNMTFYEQFLCGGYDEVTPDLLECIKECIAREGMIVDPCYSGKSLYGMCEIINRNPNYYKGKNILYWNTGGLLNLLSKKELF